MCFSGVAFKLAHFQTLLLFFGMGLYLYCFYNLPSFLSSIVFVFFIFLTLNAIMDEIFIMRKKIKMLSKHDRIKRSNV